MNPSTSSIEDLAEKLERILEGFFDFPWNEWNSTIFKDVLEESKDNWHQNSIPDFYEFGYPSTTF